MAEQQQHPITPPPELVEQWINEPGGLSAVHVATQAARWGADQELEEILLYAGEEPEDRRYFDNVPAANIRAWRRPKPPSLAEEALAALNEIEDRYAGPSTQEILVRRALKRLQELENNDN